MTYKGKKNRVLQNENLYALDEIIKEKRQRLEKNVHTWNLVYVLALAQIFPDVTLKFSKVAVS